MSHKGFNTREVAELAGVTYRMVDYWARTDVIRPSLQDATGSGSRRSYSEEDFILLRMIRQMLDQGISLDVIRTAITGIRADLSQGEIDGGSLLMISGGKLAIAHNNSDLIEIARSGAPVSIFPIDLTIPTCVLCGEIKHSEPCTEPPPVPSYVAQANAENRARVIQP